LCDYKVHSIFDAKYITTEQPLSLHTYILRANEFQEILPSSLHSFSNHYNVFFPEPNSTIFEWRQAYRRNRRWLQQISMHELAAGRSSSELQLRRSKGSTVRSLHGQSVSSTVPHCANYPISAHPAGAERKASWGASTHRL
jgi:hypothetical protein